MQLGKCWVLWERESTPGSEDTAEKDFRERMEGKGELSLEKEAE